MKKLTFILLLVLVLSLLSGFIYAVPVSAATGAGMLINGATSGSGAVGTYVTLSGTGFGKSEIVTIKFDATTMVTALA
jgi:hypothetical protein